MITDFLKQFELTESYLAEQIQAEREAEELVDPTEVEVMPDEENTLSEQELANLSWIERMVIDSVDYLWLLKDFYLTKGDIRVVAEGLRIALTLCDEITGDCEGVTENDD